jgi:hypothetical protein
MAPLKKGWCTEEDREAAGFSGIQSFFKPVNKRGQPRKRKKGNLASEVIVAKSPPSNVMPMKRPAGEVATVGLYLDYGSILWSIRSHNRSRSEATKSCVR